MDNKEADEKFVEDHENAVVEIVDQFASILKEYNGEACIDALVRLLGDEIIKLSSIGNRKEVSKHVDKTIIKESVERIGKMVMDNNKMKEFTYLQVDHICHQIGEWYLAWKDRMCPGGLHNLGLAKEELKLMICGDKDISDLEDERLQPPDDKIKLNLNDSNTGYLGDGVCAHIDEHKRLWVVIYNGISVTNQICLEDDVLGALVRYYERMKGAA